MSENWINSRAEAEMQEGCKKIMEEAAKRDSNKEMDIVGSWKITLKGNSVHTKDEVKKIMDKLVSFAMECDKDTPNLELFIDPITE